MARLKDLYWQPGEFSAATRSTLADLTPYLEIGNQKY
jgi:hypothetical protein